MIDSQTIHDLYKEEMKIRRRRKYLFNLTIGFFFISTLVVLNHFNSLDTTSKIIWKAILPKIIEIPVTDKRVNLKDLQGQGKKDVSTTCRFPHLSLYNDANKDKFEKLDPLVCSSGTDLFYLDNGIVKMNESVLKNQEDKTRKEVKKCDYLAVERVGDDYFTYTEPVIKTKPPFDIIIQHDFVQVKCNILDPEEEKEEHRKRDYVSDVKNLTIRQNQSDMIDQDMDYYRYAQSDMYGDTVENFDFDQFLVQVHPKPEVLKRKSIIADDKSTGLNVLVIGLDSLSHLSFQRILPKTYSYIRDELDFTILNGYNIVGDGTTANLIPLLTGHTEMELPEVRKQVDDSGYVDQYPMLWKDFKDHGYATLYAEDEPSINTFNLRLNGFQHQPTDHYMRPFWQALWKSTIHEISPRYCTGHTPHHQFLLGYIKDYFIKYKTMPKFAFLFMCELTHWINDPGQYLDSDFLTFLKWFKNSGELENAVVIIMADHGGRYGKVRNSVQGKIEERLPMMSIRYPTHTIENNPNLVKNLKLNKDRLVTAFDIHETILDLLDKSRFSHSSTNTSHRISLSQEIPYDRTCKDAHIDVHWCSCLKKIEQRIDDNYVRQSAKALVSHINTMTLPVRKLCRQIELVKVRSAYLMIPNEKVLRFLKEKDKDYRYANFSKEALLDIAHFEVTVETRPHGALFEATVVVNFKDSSVKLNPEISRIDRYGDQSACILKQYPDLRKFCLCHHFIQKNGG